MDMNWLLQKPIAHRGLWDKTYPENSLGAYAMAIEKGLNIEIDVHLLPDGDFAVFHDPVITRMCGETKAVNTILSTDLKNYKLKGTEYYIPTLREVLDLVDGKVGLLIEMKDFSNKKGAAEKLYEYLKDYKGNYAIQSFGGNVLEWWRKNTKDIPVGILATFFFKDFMLPIWQKTIKPDFHAFDIKFLPRLFLRARQKKGVKLLSWTIRTEALLNKCKKVGVDNIIFEGIRPESYSK